MCVVGWCRIGHAPRTAYVRVTELIGQALELVRCEIIVIPENMVVRWTTGTLGWGRGGREGGRGRASECVSGGREGGREADRER